MLRSILRKQEGSYVESSIEKTSIHYFEADRVKALNTDDAANIFVEEIRNRFEISIYTQLVYSEPALHPGWYKCCAYVRVIERK